MTRVEFILQRLEDRILELVKDFGQIKCMMEDHQTALYGDKGKPGLVGQAGTLEELRVALKGYGREPGLIAEIKDLSNRMSAWDDSRKWLTRLIFGAIITDILIHFLQVH